MAGLPKDPYHTRPGDEAPEASPYPQDQEDQEQEKKRRRRRDKAAGAALEILGDALEFVFELIFDNLG